MNFRTLTLCVWGILIAGAAVSGAEHRARSETVIGGDNGIQEQGKHKLCLVRKELGAANQNPLILLVS